MMRKYVEKKNLQNKPYHTDRFWVAPQVPKEDVASDEVFAKDLEELKENFDIKEAYIQRGQLVVYISANENVEVLTFLKHQLDYNFLTELSAIDWLEKRGEFEIFYQMLSTSKRKRLRIKFFIKQKREIRTVSNVFKSADWGEREMYDMFGVIITGHHYMKRILMPEDWYDHPLKKSYPLQGDEEASWYEIDKIFGKEYRDIIGPENRDSSRVDENDTYNFARIHHEVPFGEKPSKEIVETDYQEEGGVFLIKSLKKADSVILKERP